MVWGGGLYWQALFPSFPLESKRPMSSGTFIIKSALKRIGANSLAQPALPETITEGRDVLNSMLQMWRSFWGIKLGTNLLDAPGDELGEPLDTRNAIIDNLALNLSPDFDNGDNILSPQMQANARIGLAFVKRTYATIKIPDKVASSTLPLGQGNRRRFG